MYGEGYDYERPFFFGQLAGSEMHEPQQGGIVELIPVDLLFFLRLFIRSLS